MELAEVWEVSKPRKNGTKMYATIPKRWRQAVIEWKKAAGVPANDVLNMPLLFFGFDKAGRPEVKLLLG